jgi:hypothetical protein
MIGRLVWMVAGALLGVTGYRRVLRLVRRNRAHRTSRHAGWARGAALFARDVRDGMDLYTDRHAGLAGRTLGGQQARAERLHNAGTGPEHPGRA